MIESPPVAQLFGELLRNLRVTNWVATLSTLCYKPPGRTDGRPKDSRSAWGVHARLDRPKEPANEDALVLKRALAFGVASVVLGSSGFARAQDESEEPKGVEGALPGAEKPVGLGLSPEAPPAPPAPGGRAPSFGSPTPEDQWSFQLKGRFSGWESIGIGHRPKDPPEGYEGTPVHVPALVEGKQPFWSGAGFSLFTVYGNSLVQANVNFFARLSGKEREGRYDPNDGPAFGTAWLNVTPEPIGNARFQFKVGAFTEAYGGPGQWGWGVYGPLLAIRGYGETTRMEYTATPDLRLNFAHGVLSAPRFDEGFVRIYTGWTEIGRSTFVQHGHAGFSYKNRLTVNVHAAIAMGTDERKWEDVSTPAQIDANDTTNSDTTSQYDDLETSARNAGLLADEENVHRPALLENTEPKDGRMDVYVVDSRYIADPYGQIGLAAAFWNFNDGYAVHDGIWWGIDWTQGGREMLNKFVGPGSDGNGQLFALSGEYNLSIARLLWAPRAFDGRAPDLRVTLAGVRWWVVDTADPAFENSTGYQIGTELEYQMTSWFSARLRSYGEKRHTALGPWHAYNVSPGLSFRQDWASSDRIEVWYSRLFYNSRSDDNSARPLDRNLVAVGATLEF